MRKLLIHMMVLALAGIAPAWAGNAPSDVLDPAAIFETEKPMLNEHIVVESNVVRLGDLFTNCGELAPKQLSLTPPLPDNGQSWMHVGFIVLLGPTR